MPTLIQTGRRVFLRLALALGLLAASALPALAATAYYVDASGSQHGPVTLTDTLADSSLPIALGVDGQASWYLCSGPLTYDDTITIIGDVNLILGDNCDMRVTSSLWAGIAVTGTDGTGMVNSLTVWAQSASAAGNGPSIQGKLTAEGYIGAGIGGSDWAQDGGTVVIHGGTVTAIGGWGHAGIGGSMDGNGGITTIDGGMVIATGGYCGAGIGSGYAFGSNHGGTTTIHGGTVIATGGGSAAGIGGGNYGAGGTILIDGGTVTATAGDHAAGIGGGWDGDTSGQSITITGSATVTAMGGEYGGAGIGGGNGNPGGTILIGGGTVTATGGDHAAGIGGGWDGDGSSQSITITGSATVTARGGEFGGAGIGSGASWSTPLDPGTIVIDTTGTVQAYGGDWSSAGSSTAGADVGQGSYNDGNSNGAVSIPTHTITVTGGAGGSISPGTLDHVAEGSGITYTITPDAGYALDTLTVDGAPVTASAGVYHLAVTGAHAVVATFSKLSASAATPVPALHPALLALLAAGLGMLARRRGAWRKE